MKLLVSTLCAGLLFTGCNSNSEKEETALKAKQVTIDSMKAVMVKKAVVDSMNAVMAKREEEVREQNEAEKRQTEANRAVVQNSAAPQTTKKKKWSHTAKGAVVGAGTGAVTGALINKNRAEGAIVGTLIGAGVGAGTGAIVDNSKKKKGN
jgi:regulator of protease activity HflC (stomatin/prohibitin superfamily)